MKKCLIVFSLTIVMALINAQDVKYIFLFIADGASLPQFKAANLYFKTTQNKQFIGKKFTNVALTTTHSANSFVTDSAAAGTAIATGVKTNNGVIGLSADGKIQLQSVATYAKLNGKKVGIISDAPINHATPAAFYGHRTHRGQYYELGLDLINSNFDLFAGGGIIKYNTPSKNAKNYGNIYDLAEKKNYRVIKDYKTFKNLKQSNQKIIFSASQSFMVNAIDKTKGDITISEITKKSIDLLDNPNGFFMMIEAAKIDLLGHVNDGGSLIQEMQILQDAMNEAYQFALKHPKDTLIILTGDHETGGMALTYSVNNIKFAKKQTRSLQELTKAYNELKKSNKNLKFEDTKDLLIETFNFNFNEDKKDILSLNKYEISKLKRSLNSSSFAKEAIKIFNSKIGIGWSTSGHTGIPAITFAYGSMANLFNNQIDNTDIAKIIKSLIKEKK